MKIKEVSNLSPKEYEEIWKSMDNDIYTPTGNHYPDPSGNFTGNSEITRPFVGSSMAWPKNRESRRSADVGKSEQEINKTQDTFYLTVNDLFSKNKEYGEYFVKVFAREAEQHHFIVDRNIYKQTAQLAAIAPNGIRVILDLKTSASKPNIAIQTFKSPEETERVRDIIEDILANKDYGPDKVRVGYLDNTPKKKIIKFYSPIIDGHNVIKYNPKNIEQFQRDCIKSFRQILDLFWTIAVSASQLEDVSMSSGSIGSSFTHRGAPADMYIGAAESIYNSIKRGLSHNFSRGGANDIFDEMDDFVTIGYTRGGHDMLMAKEKRPYREHAVPCTLIARAAAKMFRNGSSIKEVANMIRRNLIIILIDYTEQARLDDSKSGFKTTMPQGDSWDPLKDNPLSRFIKLGIPVYKIEENTRLAED